MAPLDFRRYVDPGTGSLILQYLAAALLTVLVLARKRIKKAKHYLTDYLINDGQQKK